MSRKKYGTKRTDYRNRRKRNSAKERVNNFIRRFGFIIAVVVGSIWLGSWFFLSDADTRLQGWLYNKTIEESRQAGLQVQNLLIEGRFNTDPDLIRSLVNMKAGDPLMAFDPAQVKKDLERISWVKEAQVERRLPDTIYIKLKERVPYALWQTEGKVFVIDDEGAALTQELIPAYESLILVTGEGADQASGQLVSLLIAEPKVYEQTEAAMRISQRRWDLKLRNGMVVNLPANDIGLSLRRLSDAITQDNILNKDIQVIDLREDDRVIVEGR